MHVYIIAAGINSEALLCPVFLYELPPGEKSSIQFAHSGSWLHRIALNIRYALEVNTKRDAGHVILNT